MNRKKNRTIWVLLLILVVLVGAFFLLKHMNKVKEEKAAAEEAAKTIHIYEADGLQKIAYEDADGTEMSFAKGDEEWTYEADSSIPLMVDTMSTMESAFSDITAVKEIEEPDELADYGLEEPAYQMTLTDAEGETKAFLIGSATGENYYFMERDQEKIYTVSSGLVSELIWDMASLVQKESFVSVTADNFVKEVVEEPDGTTTTFDAADAEQEDEVTTVANGLAGMYFTDCVDYHVTDGTLDTYGLDAASRTKVTLTYTETNSDGDSEEKEIVFYVGTRDSTGTYYYVQLDGSQMVNEVLITSVESALGKAAEAIE